MTDAKTKSHYIRPIAGESLGVFDKIAKAAEAALESCASGANPTSLVRNTFTDQETIRTHKQIIQENKENSRLLTEEPAIARVVVVDEDNQRTAYYFSRAATELHSEEKMKFASYRSPMGRLAELSIGDEYE